MTKEIKTEIVINAPAEKVWQILTQFNLYHTWNPFIIKSEGQAIAGTRLTNTMRNGEGTITFKPVILDVKIGKSFSWMGSLWIKGLFDGNHYFEIEEISATQVNLKHGEKFSGILSGMILKKIGEQTRNNFVLMNQALKATAEAN